MRCPFHVLVGLHALSGNDAREPRSPLGPKLLEDLCLRFFLIKGAFGSLLESILRSLAWFLEHGLPLFVLLVPWPCYILLMLFEFLRQFLLARCELYLFELSLGFTSLSFQRIIVAEKVDAGDVYPGGIIQLRGRQILALIFEGFVALRRWPFIQLGHLLESRTEMLVRLKVSP